LRLRNKGQFTYQNIRQQFPKWDIRRRILVRDVGLIRYLVLANITKKTRVTMAYPGGKAGSGAYQKIINQMPPHRVYIAPFLGHDAVLRFKRPSQVSIGLDMDDDVIQAWKSALSARTVENCDVVDTALLCDSGLAAAAIAQKRDALEPIAENCELAGAPIAFHGDAGHFELNLPGVIIKKCDAISFLRSYAWQGDEFVYCDPPYLFDVRAGGRRQLYSHEFGEREQHQELLTLLLSLPCPVAISGYWSDLYMDTLKDWRTIHFQSRTRGGTMATEWLWMNYPEPTELHDYRYLGDNFRERERINRIRRNMAAKLARMDRLERYAVLSSIAELRDG
jgi:DNA adenine methylase